MAISYPADPGSRRARPDEWDIIDALAQEWRASAQTRLCATGATTDIYALDHYLRYLDERALTPASMATGDIIAYVEHCRARCRQAKRPRRRVSFSKAPAAGAPQQQVPCFSTLRTRLNALRSFYDLLVERNVCATNPLRGAVSLVRMARGEPVIEKPQAKPQRPPRTWNPSPEELAALADALAQANPRDRLLVALLLDTGLPVQRLWTLPRGAIELRRRSLTLALPDQHCLGCSPITAHLCLHYVGESSLAHHAAEAPLFPRVRDAVGQGLGTAPVYEALRTIGRRAGAPQFGARGLRRAHRRLIRLDVRLHTQALAAGTDAGEQDGGSFLAHNLPTSPVAQWLSALFPAVADEEHLPHALLQTDRLV